MPAADDDKRQNDEGCYPPISRCPIETKSKSGSSSAGVSLRARAYFVFCFFFLLFDAEVIEDDLEDGRGVDPFDGVSNLRPVHVEDKRGLGRTHQIRQRVDLTGVGGEEFHGLVAVIQGPTVYARTHTRQQHVFALELRGIRDCLINHGVPGTQ